MEVHRAVLIPVRPCRARQENHPHVQELDPRNVLLVLQRGETFQSSAASRPECVSGFVAAAMPPVMLFNPHPPPRRGCVADDEADRGVAHRVSILTRAAARVR